MSIKTLIKSIPGAQRHSQRMKWLWKHASGHFYSPVASLKDVRGREERIFDRSLREIPGVDLNDAGQLALLDELKRFYGELPYTDDNGEATNTRYTFANNMFRYSDAIFLYSMIRHFRPRRVIEVGSGYSSFVMLDTNERFFDNAMELTFIEPHDERLRSRLKESDFKTSRIIKGFVQQVDLSLFQELRAGDFLFIDSSHVSKVGSDVNYLVFEVLPRLAPGVFVHFHDMFYPFEYPKEWIEQGVSWNEDYLVRAFLQFNSAFKVVIWNFYLGLFHAEKLSEAMPLCLKDTGGGLWLQRTAPVTISSTLT